VYTTNKIAGVLHGDVPREQYYTVTREDRCSVSIVLPYYNEVLRVDELKKYNLRVDERDHRSLFVFDGTIPVGGLMRGATIVGAYTKMLSVSVHEAYQGERVMWEQHNDRALMGIDRYFVLLPSGKALVCCYHKRNLAPQYISIVRTRESVVRLSVVNSY
jgi:hypothetical protein